MSGREGKIKKGVEDFGCFGDELVFLGLGKPRSVVAALQKIFGRWLGFTAAMRESS